MYYQPDLPIINLAPEEQQLVNRPVRAHSYHSWRVSNNPGEQLTIYIQFTLRDNLGHESVFNDTGTYASGEYTGCREMEVTVEGGYDSPQVVSWTAQTSMTILSSVPQTPNLPAKHSSSSKSIEIVSHEELLTHKLVITEDAEERLFNPGTSTYEPLHNAIEETQEISRLYLPLKGTEGFVKHREDLIDGNFDRDLETADPTEPYPPPGGNFGLGVLLKRNRLHFASSTALYFYILAPTVLNGASAEKLYLTSTNRAKRGCEALVLYEQGNEAVFAIWDWSAPPDSAGNRWVVAIGYPHWGDYKWTYNLNGIDHQALCIVNTTEELSPGSWVNEVYLRKATDAAFYRVWRREFSWNPTAPSNKYLNWGPLIETFAANYGDTNIVGFAEARMVQDGIDNILNPANSEIKSECNGFQMLYLDRNYTFLAR